MTPNDAAFFDPYVGSAFHVRTEAGSPPLQLSEVRRLPAQPGAPREEPFVLTFCGPPDTPLAQRTHALEHPEAGVVEIFLVPIGPDGTGALGYEAVFN